MQGNIELIEHLSLFKHITVVEFDIMTRLSSPVELVAERVESRRRHRGIRLEQWKRLVIPALKGSFSKEHRYMRWRFSEYHEYRCGHHDYLDVIETGALEVLPHTSFAA